jgi:leucyl-tRNA synthetase
MPGWFPLAEKDLPLKLPEVEKYEPTKTGQSPLAAIENWTKAVCPICGRPARRETDTMPNWAGSSWYFLRYCDPKSQQAVAGKKKLKYWLPVDLYLGGAEHTTLHLLYSRFWHKFLNDLGLVPGKEPYKKRMVHGVILGEDGRRMSKSRGNTIDPEEMGRRYGFDATRAYLAFIGPYDGVFPWSTAGIKGTRRFLQRFFRWAVLRIEENKTASPREIKQLLERLIFEVGRDIDRFKFNTAIAKTMKFFNRAEKERIGLADLRRLLTILAPFVPYLSEELWERSGAESSVHRQQWPVFDRTIIKEEKIVLPVQVNGKMRDKLTVAADIAEQQALELALASKKAGKWLANKKIKRVFFVPGRLINIVVSP